MVALDSWRTVLAARQAEPTFQGSDRSLARKYIAADPWDPASPAQNYVNSPTHCVEVSPAHFFLFLLLVPIFSLFI